MSQETQIGNLSGGISDEDSKLVDSILNDINNSGTPQQQGNPQQGNPQQGNPQQGNPQQQPSPEQIKMMQQQQKAMRQQLMAQQQAIAQQQAMNNHQKMNTIQNESTNNILENIKNESKNIMVVIFLCILFNIDQIDSIFKSQTMFMNDTGGLNMQAVFFKALLIGIVFYIIKTYLL